MTSQVSELSTTHLLQFQQTCPHHQTEQTFLELTNPANNMEKIINTRDRKMAKYQQQIADLDPHPDTRSVKYTTLEIGSLGHHYSGAHDLCVACPSLSKQEAHSILALSAKVAVRCSYHICRACHSTEWDNHIPL
jgi:hypothetical protein